MLICESCGKEFSSSRALKLHIRYKHDIVGYIPKSCGWNTGKTKDTDVRIAKSAKTCSDNYANGKNAVKFKHHSPETIEKIRQAALKSNHRRLVRSVREYKRVDGNIVLLDSSWEEMLAHRLDSLSIDWIRPEPLKWIDNKGNVRNYFPDFYLPKYDLFIDPKNPEAYRQQGEKVEWLTKNINNLIILKSVNEIVNFTV